MKAKPIYQESRKGKKYLERLPAIVIVLILFTLGLFYLSFLSGDMMFLYSGLVISLFIIPFFIDAYSFVEEIVVDEDRIRLKGYKFNQKVEVAESFDTLKLSLKLHNKRQGTVKLIIETIQGTFVVYQDSFWKEDRIWKLIAIIHKQSNIEMKIGTLDHLSLMQKYGMD